jgi:hypothetical protein
LLISARIASVSAGTSIFELSFAESMGVRLKRLSPRRGGARFRIDCDCSSGTANV